MSESSSEQDGNRGRRSLLKGIVGVGAVGALAGLGVFGWQYITRPKVARFDRQRRSDAPDRYTVTVENDGGPGAVLVILRLFGDDGLEDRREREISMAGRTTRQVTFEVSAPEGVDRYQFEVDPQDFPERLVN